MQRTLSYGLGVFAVACAFAVTPAFAQESTTPGVTQQVPNAGVQAQGDWIKKLLEQYQTFVSKKQGMSRGVATSTATTTRQRTRMEGGVGRTPILGERIGGASASTTCVQGALDTREAALGTAWTTFNTAVSAAISARHDALYDAWDIASTSERNTALKAAWKTWNTAQKGAFDAFKTSRNTAWKTYRTTMVSTCKTTVPRDESLGRDSLGSVAI